MDDIEYVEIQRNGTFLRAVPPHCERCSGSYSHYCGCSPIIQRVQKFNQAYIPARFLNATMKSIDPAATESESLKRFYRWIEVWSNKEPLPEGGMLISGPRGIGKTHAMAAFIRNMTLQREIGCRFVDFKQFLKDIKATYNGQGFEHELFEECNDAQILIVDDVVPSNGYEWEKSVLDDVISMRYNAARPTFITTNLSISSDTSHTASDFERWALEHTTSRLYEFCHWLTVRGVDRRKQRQYLFHLPS